MRIGTAILGGAALWASGAEASSFAVVDPPREPVSASFVVLGAPSPSIESVGAATLPPLTPLARSPLDAPPDFRWGQTVVVSPSILAMGEPAIEVAPASDAPAQVAGGRTHPLALPVVIRGGVAGEAAPMQAAFTPAGSAPAEQPDEADREEVEVAPEEAALPPEPETPKLRPM